MMVTDTGIRAKFTVTVVQRSPVFIIVKIDLILFAGVGKPVLKDIAHPL